MRGEIPSALQPQRGLWASGGGPRLPDSHVENEQGGGQGEDTGGEESSKKMSKSVKEWGEERVRSGVKDKSKYEYEG